MIMKRFYFMLAILPMLVACSTNNEDEPTLIIDPVEPITKATTIKDMLMNAHQGVQFALTAEPFNAEHDAIDTSGMYEVDEPYDYPNKPGYGSGWNDMAPEDENLAKTQVPQELVEKMTTRALVQTCLNHPMKLHFMWGEDYYRKFIERLLEKNNAFKELAKRTDGGWELAIAYNNFKFVEESDENDLLTWSFTELMLENDIFLNQLTNTQLGDLYKALSVKYSIKEQHYPYVFTLLPVDIGLTILPMAKIALKFNSFGSDDARQFIQDYVKNWGAFTTTSTDVLQAVTLLTGSNLEVYEDIDVNANIDKLLGTWKVVTCGRYGRWRDYEKEGSTITFKKLGSEGTGNVEDNWLWFNEGVYSIEGNNIKLITGNKDKSGLGIDYGMKVVVLTDNRLECYAYTTWPLSSWGGEWFILEKQ